MQGVLPIVALGLTMHATANTLEGFMLAKRDFTSLAYIYALVAATLPPLHYLIRTAGWGLSGVWWLYVWFQLSRVVGFAWRGGLLRRGLWATPASSHIAR